MATRLVKRTPFFVYFIPNGDEMSSKAERMPCTSLVPQLSVHTTYLPKYLK